MKAQIRVGGSLAELAEDMRDVARALVQAGVPHDTVSAVYLGVGADMATTQRGVASAISELQEMIDSIAAGHAPGSA